MLLEFLGTPVKYLKYIAPKCISRRGSETVWAGSWFFFFFCFLFFFSFLFSLFTQPRPRQNLALQHTTLLCWVDFPSLPSAPGPVEGASKGVRCFASSAWPMAASWSFPRPSVQPQNWPPSKPARKKTVPASGSSLTGQRYVW